MLSCNYLYSKTNWWIYLSWDTPSIFFLILYSYHNRYISKTLSKYCMYYPGKASPFLTTGFSADCILGSTQKVPLKFTAVKAVFYSVASLSAHCPLSCTNERNHVSSCYALPPSAFQNLCYNIQNYHLHIIELLQSWKAKCCFSCLFTKIRDTDSQS